MNINFTLNARYQKIVSKLLGFVCFFYFIISYAATSPNPITIQDVNVTETSATASKIVIKFSQSIPQYTILNNETDSPSIAFSQTNIGPNVKNINNLRGFTKSFDVKQSDKILLLNLKTLASSVITFSPLNDFTLVVNINTKQKIDVNNKPQKNESISKNIIKPTSEGDQFEVVLLKYADVSEVVGLLTGTIIKSNDNFTVYEPAFGSAGLGGNSFNPQPLRNPEDLNRSLAESINESIGIDRRLNAIILRGTKDLIEQIKAKISAIDVPVESVVLETIFVELTDTAAKNVGLDFNNANGSIAVLNYQTGVAVTNGGTLLSADVAPNRSYLKSSALQAAIYAQVTEGNGRIVSKPRISAQSGSTAKIITGDALPIITSLSTNGYTVGQQVQYVNVGVTLQIAPRVSEDGFVTSHIFCVVSSVTGYTSSSNSNYPKISQREAETSATVGDGETFVIGGLTQENELNSNTKVPLLGDIPLFGKIFQRDNNSKNKTQLYIVVTPRIAKKGQMNDFTNP